MKAPRLPQTDSIEELARFWEAHDLTDFADELEEVPGPVFERKPEITLVLRLDSNEVREVDRIARSRGIERSDLLREWVLEKLSPARKA